MREPREEGEEGEEHVGGNSQTRPLLLYSYILTIIYGWKKTKKRSCSLDEGEELAGLIGNFWAVNDIRRGH